jgi:hypothetical protein
MTVEQVMEVEILPKIRRITRYKRRGARAIACYLYPGDPCGERRVYNRAQNGTLIHYTDGGMLVADTLMLKLYELLEQMLSIQRKPFTPQQVADCMPAFVLYVIEDEPTLEEIEQALIRVIQNITRTRH